MKRFLVPAALLLAMALGTYVAGRLLAGPGSGPVEPAGNGDVNGSGQIDISDAVYLLNWLFSGGPDPVAIAGSADLEARLLALESRVDGLEGSLSPGEGWESAFASLERILEPERPAEALPPGELRKVLRDPGATSDAAFFIDEAQVGEVAGFIAREEISTPFECLVLVRTASATLSSRDLVGRNGRLLFHRAGRMTAWSGVVTELGLAGFDAEGAFYRARIVPPIAKLARRTGSRIFQDMRNLEIVAEVLAASGIAPPDFRIAGAYPRREYVVQWKESDLAFVSRLLEEEGIWYSFSHADEGPVMVIGDSPAAHDPEPVSPIIYRGHEAGPASPGEESIHRFQTLAAAFTGAVTVGGHDFETGALPAVTASAPGGDGEAYEYEGGAAATSAEAARLASIRLGEALAGSQPCHGASSSGDLRAGRLVTIEGSTGDRFNGKYLVRGVTHRYVDPKGSDGGFYGNKFTCIPDSVTFRPPRRTPVPRATGAQSATVTGPAGEEIHTDEHGRVKVQFHWDREGTRDDRSSAWIRAAGPAAGHDRGMLMLPEVGDEVLVAFEQGDLRSPYVIGSVWNGTNPPPELLPEGRTTSSIGTNRSSPAGANEIVFEDAAGREGIRLRAPLLDLAAPATVARGALRSAADAGPEAAIAPGERYRDNAIVAWARVGATGLVESAFGVASIEHPGPGAYAITIAARAASPLELIATATPVVTAPPRSIDDVRIAAVQVIDAGTVQVFISDGNGRPVDSAFSFLATAR